MTVTIDWVEIPHGEFIFGLESNWAENAVHQLVNANPQALKRATARMSSEMPAQRVYLPTFYISRYPITWQQLLEFAQTSHWNPTNTGIRPDVFELVYKSYKETVEGTYKVAEHPADVIWQTARAFCKWVRGRLPTSEEWEKAARGTDGRIYTWGNEWDETRGNFGPGRGLYATTPINAYPSGQSPYGVMDMLGNMYEHTGSIVDFNGTNRSVCRSCSCHYTMAASDNDPQWFRNRVTSTMPIPMAVGGPPLVCFRPVKDRL